jgi:hypothetical protein
MVSCLSRYSLVFIDAVIGFRLDCESAVLLTFTAFFAVILRNQINDVVSRLYECKLDLSLDLSLDCCPQTNILQGLIGYTLTYTLSLSGLLQWCCRQSAETENMLTSVERISVYSELPPEPGKHTLSPLMCGTIIPANFRLRFNLRST